jgi:hypothetical protein
MPPKTIVTITIADLRYNDDLFLVLSEIIVRAKLIQNYHPWMQDMEIP